MSRQRFGAWGAELDEAEFARALAALGVFETRPQHGPLKPRGPEDVGPPRTYRWIDDLSPPDTAVSAAELAQEWREELAETVDDANKPRLRLEIDVERWWPWVAPPDASIPWLVDTLARAEYVSAVQLVMYGKRLTRAWDWPVDVGFLQDRDSRALRDAVAEQYWKRFVRIVDVGEATAQIDLLLFPGTLAQALAAIASSSRLPEVHTVLALGGLAGTRDPLASLAALAAESGAAAAGAVAIPPEKANAWLDAVLFALSHDHALDEALFSASHLHGAAGPPLLLSHPGALRTARTSAAATRLVGRIARAAPKMEAKDLPADRLRERLGLDAKGTVSDLAKKLTASVHELPWSREGETATDVAELASASAATRASEGIGRFVQGRMLVAGGEVERVATAALERGVRHVLEVMVGTPREGWIRPQGALDESELPPSDDGHTLTIVFIAPGVVDDPRTTELWLPVRGDSASVRFAFVVPAELARFDGRVTVLHENRILQTLRVRAEVARGEAASPPPEPVAPTTPPVSITLETALRTNLGNLEGSAGFDLALLLNDTGGEHGLSAFADGNAAFLRLSNIEKLIEKLQEQLELITESPSNYASMKSEATRVLLVTLARLGHSFLRAVRELPRVGPLVPAPGTRGRIQILSMDPKYLVPFELAYERGHTRDDAKLCPQWKECLQGGRCTSARDPDQDGQRLVCPASFWGIAHLVERRLYDEVVAREIQDRGGQVAITSEPGGDRPALGPLKTLLFGAADRAANFDLAGFNRTKKALSKTLSAAGITMVSAKKWSEWTSCVESKSPEVLLLLPHTDESLGDMTLEIGTQALDAGLIGPQHVCKPEPKPPRPGPIVFLLGCRTATTDLPFSDFVNAFRRANASVVIATLSTVRGRHMAPVAGHAIAVLLDGSTGKRRSIGELVIALRAKVLAGGNPVGLTLVAYGDIDWQLNVGLETQ